jgi:aminoglycoside 3-N-acetyltransferase I
VVHGGRGAQEHQRHADRARAGILERGKERLVLIASATIVTNVRYTYRQLASADVSLLKDLLRTFGEAFGETDTYQRSVPSDDYLRRLLSKQHFISVVAMNDGEVVGGLAAYELDKFEQDRREIYIYDLAVAEKHRRRGVATELIRELRKIASRRNAYVIFVQADPEDGPAIALYRSLGTQKAAYHFDIGVPKPVARHGGGGDER